MHNEQLAREWAESVRDSDPIMSERAHAAAEYILTHVPAPTMAEVDWDDEKHRGLGAVDEAGQEWVMLQDDGGYINCIGLDLNPVGAERGELTPNGKRYELREVGECEPDRGYCVQTSRDDDPDEYDWEGTDKDGLCREDYMEDKPWKWYGPDDNLTLEQAVTAVRIGAHYERPYRILDGDNVVLTVFPAPEKPEAIE